MYPLTIIGGKIKIFRLLGGLPLRLDEENVGQNKLRFVDILRLILTVFAGSLSVMMTVIIIMVAHGGANLAQVATYLGYSMIDAVTYNCGFVFAAIAIGMLFATFIRKHSQLAELCRHLEDISQKLRLVNYGIRFHETLKRKCGYLSPYIVVMIIVQVAGTFFSYTAAVPNGGNDFLKWFYVSTSFLFTACVFFHPIILGGHLVTFFLISFLTGCYEEFCHQIQSKMSKEKLMKPVRNKSAVGPLFLVQENPPALDESRPIRQQIEEAVTMGQLLCHATDKTNTTLGSFLMILFAFTTSAGTGLIYGFAGIMFGPYVVHKILFAVSSGMIGLVYFLSLHYLCSAGQKLEDVRKRTKEELNRKLRECYQLGDPLLQHDVAVLDKRLGEPNPLSPFGYFSINNSGFLAAISTIFTYLIVLLSFKDNEKRCT